MSLHGLSGYELISTGIVVQCVLVLPAQAPTRQASGSHSTADRQQCSYYNRYKLVDNNRRAGRSVPNCLPPASSSDAGRDWHCYTGCTLTIILYNCMPHNLCGMQFYVTQCTHLNQNQIEVRNPPFWCDFKSKPQITDFHLKSQF